MAKIATIGSAGVPTRNVHLTEHFDAFISSGIDAGRYSNASEAVRAGLRLLEQREKEDQARIEWLRGATSEALTASEQGEGVTLNTAEDIDRQVDRSTRVPTT